MGRPRKDTVHPLGCACRACAPRACRDRRLDLAIRSTTRALFLIAAICAMPFIVAGHIASMLGDNR